MTPQELALGASDAVALGEVAEPFQLEFYAVLFEPDPDLRALFPTEMGEQRAELFAELEVLVDFVVQIGDRRSERRFAVHARELGRRHEVYGVTPPVYDTVRRSLPAALLECLPGFDDGHATAWTKVYAMAHSAMQERDLERTVPVPPGAS